MVRPNDSVCVSAVSRRTCHAFEAIMTDELTRNVAQRGREWMKASLRPEGRPQMLSSGSRHLHVFLGVVIK